MYNHVVERDAKSYGGLSGYGFRGAPLTTGVEPLRELNIAPVDTTSLLLGLAWPSCSLARGAFGAGGSRRANKRIYPTSPAHSLPRLSLTLGIDRILFACRSNRSHTAWLPFRRDEDHL